MSTTFPKETKHTTSEKDHLKPTHPFSHTHTHTHTVVPDSSTTGRAGTLLSTKMLRALMMGVSGWMKAMLLYVPILSSSKVFFMNAGLGISHT